MVLRRAEKNNKSSSYSCHEEWPFGTFAFRPPCGLSRSGKLGKKINRQYWTQLIRTDITLFKGFHLWESVGDLQFSLNGEQLQAHPNVVLLLVKLLTPVKDDTPALPSKQAREHQTGKRRLPPDDERLPSDSIPSSYHLMRKKIRLEDDSPMVSYVWCFKFM